MSKIFESMRRARPAFPAIDLGAYTLEGEQPGVTKPAEQPPLAAEENVSRELRIPESAPLLPFDGTHPRASEQYRILRTKIAQHSKEPKCIVISSAGVGDGKSTTAINVAAAFALKTDARILLMDGDFRRATIASQLGLPAEPGLADVLGGKCLLESATVRAAQIPNLHVLPAGRPTLNPSELLDSTAWASLCLRCRQMYEFIFIDSPPIGTVADFDLIHAHCDGVVLVARQDHTKRGLLLETLKKINKDKLLGVVLNATLSWPLARHNNSNAYYYYASAGSPTQ
jgi:capsular exopolysaccharide synthesis family protein